ncbi:MAG: hypothetical protein MI976_17700 [Pseudomonadales bacterium]|nr:hypothetical protein [Pseudomonadales bacterium]
MQSFLRGLMVITLGVFPFISSHSIAVTPDTISRGWKPPVAVAGNGHPEVAVEKLREVTDLQRVVFNNTEYHQQTQAFVDGLWSSLERFDLGKFYSLLPEEENGWRQLKVYGAREGALYRVGPESSIIGSEDGLPQSFGDLSVLVRAKQVTSEKHNNYLLSSTVSVGVGELQWPSVVQATEYTFNNLVNGDTDFTARSENTPDYRFIAKVKKMNSKLGDEDIAVIAPLWAAFPEMWDLLAKLGQVQEVVVESIGARSYQHMRASFQIKPELMEQHYPDLAGHLDKLNSLLKVDMDINDSRGTLLHVMLDSENLKAHVEAYIKDGQLLPVFNRQVMVEADPIPAGKYHELTANIKTRMNILGIVTHMNNMRADIAYQQHDGGARITTQVNKVPNVRVDGYALGIMPTGVINFFMPKSIDELMLEFLEVACYGNEGNGIVAEMDFEHGVDQAQTKVHFTTQFEGLDNFMVRIGMGIVSDRIIPDPGVSDDIRRLVFDTQEAFASDLDGFAHAVSQKPRLSQLSL